MLGIKFDIYFWCTFLHCHKSNVCNVLWNCCRWCFKNRRMTIMAQLIRN